MAAAQKFNSFVEDVAEKVHFNVPKATGQKDATIATLVDKQPPPTATATHPS